MPKVIPVEEATMTDTAVDRVLDVRELSEPPFEPIMAELDELGADEDLLLVNSFEPAPLYETLEQRGLTYETDQVDEDEWHVRISRPRTDSA